MDAISQDGWVAVFVATAWLLGLILGLATGRLSDQREIALVRAQAHELQTELLELRTQLEAMLPGGDATLDLVELWDEHDQREAIDSAGAGAWLEMMRRDVGRG